MTQRAPYAASGLFVSILFGLAFAVMLAWHAVAEGLHWLQFGEFEQYQVWQAMADLDIKQPWTSWAGVNKMLLAIYAADFSTACAVLMLFSFGCAWVYTRP